MATARSIKTVRTALRRTMSPRPHPTPHHIRGAPPIPRSTYTRAAHDVGLAAWFGGTLANAVALNPASGRSGDPASTGRVAADGWDRWTPVNAAAIGLHLAGSIGQLGSNAGRVAAQPGVGAMAVTKTALTVASLGATAYARLLGRRLSQQEGDVPADSATEPVATTPEHLASAQRQLSALQWVVPVLTGLVVVISALAGEQQRVSEAAPATTRGLVARLTGRRG